ncbi:hypothetical protein TVAG_415110 [Trichomonas vaginalis G3]|uniref:Uncharacterized protein n=1 Tax=Trichomonas vaginalis (strain ATCC PRA-98 / G3) TaxID=412133 RepID=A2FAJ4_TRIV3|nr:hypothetical protein TVAGG3_0480000 [Trichomonas vaginalis G3]EAX98087.1 hypothetical protein TVAG_415110 [Trichomonas vaginalis G3]KAI5515632.1 hypothetical protein TVAGG3_0480000 [Trichomonas vaginalis G3]|eukprot:XP_001311017.1 hypothetical protein [Trichomonas vaginalis G3]
MQCDDYKRYYPKKTYKQIILKYLCTLIGNTFRRIKLFLLGSKVMEDSNTYTRNYPKWIKINYFATLRYPPYKSLNITPDNIIIDYFRSQTKDSSETTIYKGKEMLYYQSILRFNRFYTLSDEDITTLGKFAMKLFVKDYDRNHLKEMHYYTANKMGCIFEGIITDYAILHDAPKEVIESIQEFAKGTKYTEDFTFSDQFLPRRNITAAPIIHYKTGKYIGIHPHKPEDLGLEILQAAECCLCKM